MAEDEEEGEDEAGEDEYTVMREVRIYLSDTSKRKLHIELIEFTHEADTSLRS